MHHTQIGGITIFIKLACYKGAQWTIVFTYKRIESRIKDRYFLGIKNESVLSDGRIALCR